MVIKKLYFDFEGNGTQELVKIIFSPATGKFGAEIPMKYRSISIPRDTADKLKELCSSEENIAKLSFPSKLLGS